MWSVRVSIDLMTHNQSIHDHGVDNNGLSGSARWQTCHSVEVLPQVLYMHTKEEGLQPLNAAPVILQILTSLERLLLVGTRTHDPFAHISQ